MKLGDFLNMSTYGDKKAGELVICFQALKHATSISCISFKVHQTGNLCHYNQLIKIAFSLV